MRKLFPILILVISSCAVRPNFKYSENIPNGYVIDDSQFSRIASMIYNGDINILYEIYSIADSLSSEPDKERTLNVLSDKMSDAFFNPASKFHNDSIYVKIISIEDNCKNFTSDHKRVLSFRKSLINLGKSGSLFPIRLSLDKLTLVLVKGEECKMCKKLESMLAKDMNIKKLIDAGRIDYIVLSSDDMPEIMERLDTRLIPSFYLINSDGTVIVKGTDNLSIIFEKIYQELK